MINVDYLARVEGEGALRIHIQDDKVTDVQLNIFEPPRFFEEAGSSGPDFDVPPLNRDDFLRARARYYKVRGLDADGAPTRDKAKELDLEWNDS